MRDLRRMTAAPYPPYKSKKNLRYLLNNEGFAVASHHMVIAEADVLLISKKRF